MIRLRPRLLAAGIICAFLFVAAPVSAEVKLAGVFSDDMVLQRDATLPVWGWADEGEKVTVTLVLTPRLLSSLTAFMPSLVMTILITIFGPQSKYVSASSSMPFSYPLMTLISVIV